MTHDRVTAVLSPFSGLNRVPPAILANAQDRGTKVHEYFESFCENIWQVVPSEYQGYITSLEQWTKDKKFLDKPSRWYCDELLLSGECDGLYPNETGYTLFDIKTPLKESKTWKLQGSAYSYLGKKAGFKITKIEFIKLSKDGSAPEIFTYEEDFDSFKKCLDVYRMFFKSEKDLFEYI